MDRKIDKKAAQPAKEVEKYRISVAGDATSPLFFELTSSLGQGGFSVVTIESLGGPDYLSAGDELDYEVLFLITPEVSPKNLQLLRNLQQAKMAILMVSNDCTNHTIEKATLCGVHAYLTDVPCGPHLGAVIAAAVARSKMFKSMSAELNDARQTLKERKIVERAKGILMHRKALDEATAYRAMQKMAMNRNVKLIELAQSMITASELLDVSN